MNIGKSIDDLYAMAQRRKNLEAELAAIKKAEAVFEEDLRLALLEQGLVGGKGEYASYTLRMEVNPQVLDWEELYSFIRSQNSFELLHKRIGAKAWRERYEGGLLVPGTEPVEIFQSSLRKI